MLRHSEKCWVINRYLNFQKKVFLKLNKHFLAGQLKTIFIRIQCIIAETKISLKLIKRIFS